MTLTGPISRSCLMRTGDTWTWGDHQSDVEATEMCDAISPDARSVSEQSVTYGNVSRIRIRVAYGGS